MSVYVDPLVVWGGDSAPPCFRHKPSCHMFADSLDELHRMALLIGMRRSWFQDRPSLPHYDLTPEKRKKAVRLGAKEVDNKFLVRFMRGIQDDKKEADQTTQTAL